MPNLSVSAATPKKEYNPPILIVHGTVKDLTQTVGVNGTVDGGIRLGRTNTHV